MQSSIIQKLLLVLETISKAAIPPTFTDLVDRTGLNKSTLHRVLSICAEEALVRYDPQRRVYRLGPRVFDLVRDAHDSHDIQAIALDEMVRLFELYDANVTIGVPSGLAVSYLRILESRHGTGGFQRPGMRDAVHCSASGKALMAYHPDAVLDLMFRDYEFTRHTCRTVTSLDAFKAELAFVRAHGYGVNDREEYDHFLGISAPVFNHFREPVAVLNIWSVYPRHRIEDLKGWSAELTASAARVTALIGGERPEPLS